jgi:hypothetical protein
MTTHDLTALLNADLSDYENRFVLADALEEAGRPEEADLARDLDAPAHRDRVNGLLRPGFAIDEVAPHEFRVVDLPGGGRYVLAAADVDYGPNVQPLAPHEFRVVGLPGDGRHVLATADVDYGPNVQPLARYVVLGDLSPVTVEQAKEAIRDHVEGWADNAWTAGSRLILTFDRAEVVVVRGEEYGDEE